MSPAAPRRGRLFALEGIDGSGKSTQTFLLAEALGARPTFEPGATGLGRLLREALLHHPDISLSERAEALLVAADRAQHAAEVLEPILAEGWWVVSDRYSASTLAYQGFGRGLDLEDLRRLTRFASGGLEADLSVLLDLPVGVARRRLTGPSADRLERLGADFFQRVRDGYLALAEADPSRWAVVDATAPVDDVAAAVLHAVRAYLES